jgi:hypothetical protein
MSLENYDAVTFISNKLIDELNYLIATQIPQENELIKILTDVIVNSIIEFYELENSEENRKKINSLFHLYLNIIQRLQLHIKNKSKDFDSIAYLFGNEKIYFDAIKKMVGKLVELLEKKYPEWVEGAEFKKTEILPYKKTPFQGDELGRGIYDWNTTFETLEKIFYSFLFDNLGDDEYEKYKSVIDRNLDKLKEYVEKNNYKTYIGYDKMFPNIMIKTLEQGMIYDKKYFSGYIESLRDIGIDKKLFDKDFIKFLEMFRKFIKG